MSIAAIQEVFNSFGSVIIQSLEFIISLPKLLVAMINIIPNPFRSSFLMYFPIIFGLFIWKLVKG